MCSVGPFRSPVTGRPVEAVLRRLRAAAELRAARRERPLPLLCVGGGTSHKPRVRDARGFAVPEAHEMARFLVDERGVPRRQVFVESFSDDTIGNIFCARTLHCEWRQWRRLLLVTSDFQVARAEAIAQWVFGLPPQPASFTAQKYAITAVGVPDGGAMDAEALEARRVRERASLAAFVRGARAEITDMATAHEFLFQDHNAYAFNTQEELYKVLMMSTEVDEQALKTY